MFIKAYKLCHIYLEQESFREFCVKIKLINVSVTNSAQGEITNDDITRFMKISTSIKLMPKEDVIKLGVAS